MENPRVLCSSGSLSATKARNGSIEMLIEESNIQSNPAAIHKDELLGIKINAIELKIAPTKKNGLLLPNLGCQVLSLQYPIMGCTISPVSGAANHKNGNLSGSAPKYS